MTEAHSQTGDPDVPTTAQKALRINQDAGRFGTFAEIGGGQEVVRWFFHVGRAANTVAKSISAYDTVVSDDIYGPTDRYVSRGRLTAMLDHEYALLLKELDSKRGDKSSFFVFAATVATHSRPHQPGGHGWLGIRYQTQPRSQPSEIIIHVQLLDPVTIGEQEVLGMLGVNLIHGAFYLSESPQRFIGALMDGLSRVQVEVDMIKFSGPAFSGVDNRLMSLQLVEQSLADAAMFTAEGEVVQPSEVLYGKPVLIERGNFRPATNVHIDILEKALAQMQRDQGVESRDPVVLMEMTLRNLMTGPSIDHQDFLDRVDTLGALGKMVLISNYTRFERVTAYLRRSTRSPIAMAMGLPTLQEIFDEKYYTDLDGGILEGVGRLFQGAVKLYVYPMKSTSDGQVLTADTLVVAPNLRHLYAHLLDNGFIQPIREFREEQLHIFPDDVRAMIQSGDPAWESIVPAPVAECIKKTGLFGWRAREH